MWVLALRMKANQTSPLISLSIAGVLNIEADFASYAFHDNQGQPLTVQTFVSLFNNKFQQKKTLHRCIFITKDSIETDQQDTNEAIKNRILASTFT